MQVFPDPRVELVCDVEIRVFIGRRLDSKP